jgi:hypothetical protein
MKPAVGSCADIPRRYIFETVLLPEFATQMLLRRKATPVRLMPQGNVPCNDPLLALSIVTVLSAKFATQMFTPSNVTPF